MSIRSTTWTRERHTTAKHTLIRTYLKAWFPIISRFGREERVIFLDGFAGPGIYDDGEPGSPIIALETLLTHRNFGKLEETTFEFLFVEKDADRIERLKSEVAGLWSRLPGAIPPNVHIRYYNEEFVTVARDVLPTLRQSEPTFAFVDPFGWDGTPLSVIGDSLASDRCEVLFTFMSEQVNRFLTHPAEKVRFSFEELFGTGDYRQAARMAGDRRKRFLRDLYVEQLREVAGFRFATPFEFRDMRRGSRTIYFLMFGTHHVKGLDRMKGAMWNLDPEGGVLFAGLTDGDPLLFKPAADLALLEAALTKRFTGYTVPVQEVEEFVIIDTDYTSNHYRKVLRGLERTGLLEAVSGRKKLLSYPTGTVLRFRTTAKPKTGQLSLDDL